MSIRHVESTVIVACPFCEENGFDLKGLKMHITYGWCDAFTKIELK